MRDMNANDINTQTTVWYRVQCLGHKIHKYRATYKPHACRVCGGKVVSVVIK